MNFNPDFVNEHTGKDVNFPNCEVNQCMTLMHVYNQEVLGLTDPLILAEPTAVQVFTKFPDVVGSDHFTLVKNDPDSVPESGDLIFFEKNDAAQTEEAGHVCLFLKGDVNRFTSFDSNYPTGSQPHVQEHTYDGVLGWLHPITPEAKTQEAAQPDPNAYPYGLDLNNPDTVKVCVDIWKEVTDGKFVRKEEYDAVNTQLTDLQTKHTELEKSNAELPNVVKQTLAQKIVTFFDNL